MKKITAKDLCNCTNKNNCPLDGSCQKRVIYKCIASTSINTVKVYLRAGEGNLKERYYNL